MGSALQTPERREAETSIQPRPPAPPPEPPIPARWRRYAVFAVVLVVGAMAIARAWPLLFPPVPVQEVIASGRIEGREVTVAPKTIQGRVVRLLADEGETVKKGQLLAQLDAAELDAKYAAASAAVAAFDAQISQAGLDVAYTSRNTVANIAAADAAVSSAQAVVARAQAVLANARTDYERVSALFTDGIVSRRDIDAARTNLDTSRADAEAADTELARARATLAMAQAGADTVGLKRQQLRALQESRRAALGQLAEVQASLDERQVVSPADGTILSRLVEVGNVVNPGGPMFQIVDMSRLYLKVYVPETDVGKLRLGDRADITIDAFPGRTFPARISQIHDEAEFTPKNVETAEERLKLVFGVELTFVRPDAVLKPGMPADCAIHWSAAPAREGGHGS